MIQQQTKPKTEPDPGELKTDAQLRQRINSLIHERDFWQGIAETKGERLSTMLDENRFRLSVHCDVKTCKAVLSVSSSEPPPDGKLALGLVMAAAVMRWRMGPETVEQIRALVGSDASLAVTGKSDRCPLHHEPEEK